MDPLRYKRFSKLVTKCLQNLFYCKVNDLHSIRNVLFEETYPFPSEYGTLER